MARRDVYERIYDFVTTHPIKIILFFIALTFCAGYGLRNVKFSQEYEDFLPKDSQEFKEYSFLKETFGWSSNFIVIPVIPKEGGVFSPQCQKIIRLVSLKLQRLAATQSVVSPAITTIPIISSSGKISNQYLLSYDANKRIEDSMRVIQDPYYSKLFLSTQHNATAIYIYHRDKLAKSDADAYLSEIENILQPHLEKVDASVVGRIAEERDVLHLMSSQFNTAIITLALILLAAFCLIFKRVVVALIASVSLLIPLVWVIGFMGYLDIHTNILTLALPAIILTVGTSDIVHIGLYYLRNIRTYPTTKESLKTIFTQLGISTFFTSFTTAVGFMSLNSASLQPIRQLGMAAAIGVLIAFIVAFVFFPAMLLVLAKPRTHLPKKQLDDKSYKKNIDTILARIFIFSLRYRLQIMLVTFVILIVSVLGITQLHIKTYLLEDVQKDNPIRKKFDYIDKELGGIRSFEMLVYMKGGGDYKMTDKVVLEEIDRVCNYVESQLGVNNVLSTSILAKKVNRALHNGRLNAEVIPDTFANIATYFNYVNGGAEQPIKVLDEEKQVSRIYGRMQDVGSEKALALKDKFYQHFTDDSLKYIKLVWTGSAYLVDLNNQFIVDDTIQGLLWGTLFILLCMLYMIRNVRHALLSIIVNFIPIIITAGTMGFLGVRIRLVTVIIFSIVLGISIDNLIHLFARYGIDKKDKKNTPSNIYILKKGFIVTSKGIITSTLMLAIGFLSLLQSGFLGIFLVGVFLTMPLILSATSVLLLMPGLLINKRKK